MDGMKKREKFQRQDNQTKTKPNDEMLNEKSKHWLNPGISLQTHQTFTDSQISDDMTINVHAIS